MKKISPENMVRKDRALALAVGIEKIGALRSALDPERWEYFAEETQSWWSVSADSVIALADSDEEAPYEKWAEADTGAFEVGRKPSR